MSFLYLSFMHIHEPRGNKTPLQRTATPTSAPVTQLLFVSLPSRLFSQAALGRKENEFSIDDLPHMFGGRIFGGGSLSLSSSTSGDAAWKMDIVMKRTRMLRECHLKI